MTVLVVGAARVVDGRRVQNAIAQGLNPEGSIADRGLTATTKGDLSLKSSVSTLLMLEAQRWRMTQ
jgi:hypothetical protein